MKNQAGSAAVESIYATLALSLIVGGGLVVVYVNFARVWLERSAYELVVCLASTQTEARCEKKTRATLPTALPIGRLARLHATRSKSRARVELEFAIGDWTIHARDERALPLEIR